MDFSEFLLPDFLKDNIRALGWEKPTPIQYLCIKDALLGKDILGGSPTGSGKSGAFLIPLIARLFDKKSQGIGALILEPTRELALQVEAVLLKLLQGQSLLRAGTIIGGGSREVERDDPSDIICATPGRLGEYLKKGWISTDEVQVYVIDEADRMLDMGFKDEVNSITAALKKRSLTMLFSATLEGRGIRDFAEVSLHNPVEVRLTAGEETAEKMPENLSARAYYAAGEPQKIRILSHLLTTVPERAIVFVKQKEKVGKVESALRRLRFSCATLHGDLSMNERKAAIRNFTEGNKSILIATDVAARGLDLPQVGYVYNYDMPPNAAVYVHRAGRTARAGQKGVVVSLVLGNEMEFLTKLENYTKVPIEKRAIANVCAAFPSSSKEGVSLGKRVSRASTGGHGGFDKKHEDKDKARKIKLRLRDKKNKGKPDFAAKRAKKALRKQNAE